MPTTAIPPLNPVTYTPPDTASSTSTSATSGSELDRDAFLKLLVAQLKYQDPTNPTDPASMMAQTSQLTMVERLDDIAKALTAAAATDQLTLAGSMVGRQVTFQSDQGPISATVESVRFVNGEFVLAAGGYAVPIGAVVEISQPPAPPSSGGAASSGNLLGAW